MRPNAISYVGTTTNHQQSDAMNKRAVRFKGLLNRRRYIASILVLVCLQTQSVFAVRPDVIVNDAMQIFKECGNIPDSISVINQQLSELDDADREGAATLYLQRGLLRIFSSDQKASKSDFDHAIEIAPEYYGKETVDFLLQSGVGVWEYLIAESSLQNR